MSAPLAQWDWQYKPSIIYCHHIRQKDIFFTLIYMNVRQAVAAVSSTNLWPDLLKASKYQNITTPLLIKDRCTACLNFRLFIAHHLHPGKLTDHFETLEPHQDQEDKLTCLLTVGARRALRGKMGGESRWGWGRDIATFINCVAAFTTSGTIHFATQGNYFCFNTGNRTKNIILLYGAMVQ